MLQAAGHAGTLKQDNAFKGFILKPLDELEAANYEALWASQDDPIQEYVAPWGGTTEILVGSEETGEKKQFMRLGNLLEQFKKPCVMDCKMGVRTFQEKEAKSNKPRPDLYQKLNKLLPESITPEEHEAGSITKYKWTWSRDAASTSQFGMRIDGIVSEQGARIDKQVLDKFATKDEALQALPYVLPLQFSSEETGKQCIKQQRLVLMQQIVDQLDGLRTAMENSNFVQTHEFVGASLLFVVDHHLAKVYLIDLAKTALLPEGQTLDHRSAWVMGNREDGILMGMDSLLELWTKNLKYFEEHGCFLNRLDGGAMRALQQKLHSYQVDTSQWGKDGAKSLEELYSEINEEKAVTFEVSEDGCLFRVMDVIKAWVMVDFKDADSGQLLPFVLTEPKKHSKHSDNETKTSKKPKGKPLQKKVTEGHDWKETVHQAIKQRLGIEPENQSDVFEFKWRTYKRKDDVRLGTLEDGFNCLWSKYRVHEIDIRVKNPEHPALRPLGLPEGTPFTTMQSGGMHSAFGHRQHNWQWQAASDAGYVARGEDNCEDLEVAITLQRKSPDDKLGVGWQRAEDSADDDMFIAEFAETGLLPAWNLEFPELCAKVGDRLVEVNGVRGPFDELAAECQSSLTLKMLLYRQDPPKKRCDPTASMALNLRRNPALFGSQNASRPHSASSTRMSIVNLMPFESGENSRVLLLDCGSGSTRGSFYFIEDDGSLNAEHLPNKLDPIHTVIIDGPESIKTFLDKLVVMIAKSGKRPVSVILGACGGLRHAIAAGEITPEMVTSFRCSLQSHEGLHGTGILRELTGEDEAYLEHKAVQYMASKVLPSLSQPVGLFGSGGTSTQVVYFPNGSDASSETSQRFSLHTNFKQQQLKIIEVGVEEGLASLDKYLEELLASSVPELIGKLKGVFCCIETMGQIGEIVGIGHKLVSKKEAVDACTACLEEYKLKTKSVDPKAEGWTYKETFRGAMPILALRLLSLLGESAQLYFADTWKLPSGRTMQAVVPVGLYLESFDFRGKQP